METILEIIWKAIGMVLFVYWWIKERDFKVIDLLFLPAAGASGPFMIFLPFLSKIIEKNRKGWSEVLIKKQTLKSKKQ